jgi:hypothetical protein
MNGKTDRSFWQGRSSSIGRWGNLLLLRRNYTLEASCGYDRAATNSGAMSWRPLYGFVTRASLRCKRKPPGRPGRLPGQSPCPTCPAYGPIKSAQGNLHGFCACRPERRRCPEGYTPRSGITSALARLWGNRPPPVLSSTASDIIWRTCNGHPRKTSRSVSAPPAFQVSHVIRHQAGRAGPFLLARAALSSVLFITGSKSVSTKNVESTHQLPEAPRAQVPRLTAILSVDPTVQPTTHYSVTFGNFSLSFQLNGKGHPPIPSRCPFS